MTTLYTRRHYQHIATMMGDLGRTQSETEWQRTLATMKTHLTGTNPNMVWQKIVEWANDVRDGRRDIDGKKVAVTATGYERFRAERERLFGNPSCPCPTCRSGIGPCSDISRMTGKKVN